MGNLKQSELFAPNKGAEFSDDRVYRYTLWREWGNKTVAFIGLNPSTADENIDDPTIRRCINFAKSWGFGRMVMLNLFAFRATDPRDMKACQEPIGPENDKTLEGVSYSSDLVVCAWGVHGAHIDRGDEVTGMLLRRGIELHCLGRTTKGYPKHPRTSAA
jgi:hypothetical protein